MTRRQLREIARALPLPLRFEPSRFSRRIHVQPVVDWLELETSLDLAGVADPHDRETCTAIVLDRVAYHLNGIGT